MKRLLYFIYILAAAMLSGCAENAKTQGGESAAVPYNPFVDAFTVGTVSRFAPVYLVFNQDIPTEYPEGGQLDKHIRISPSAQGTFALENPRTIVFRPSEQGLRRGTEYKVNAELSQWFDTGRDSRIFTFTFKTFPLEMRANFESITTTGDDGFTVVATILTPDSETAADVESVVEFSEKVDASWEHSSDGRNHTLTIGIGARDKRRWLDIEVGNNKLGAERGRLLQVNIPGRNDFTVHNVALLTDPVRCVEVSFTEQLDDTQDLQGIAYIEGNTSEVATIEANKIRLYPDAGREGVLNIFLGSALRSKSGLRLGEDMVRQAEIATTLPSVRFASEGVIIPQGGKLTVPFQSVNLRGVIVKVIRIYENNIGQFLQSNAMGESYNLARVGRPVTRQVVFLDEAGDDLSQWNTFALDLGKYMEPEPGAMYRVEFSFTRDLSVYPCADPSTATKEEIAAIEAEMFRKEAESYDRSDYYYYYDEYDWWSDYDYRQRENPCSNSYYRNRSVGRNILATNLGLIAKQGEDGTMTVSVHNLLTTKPESGVEVVAYNYQLQPVGRGATDIHGRVQVACSGGTPFYIVASQGKQRNYLKVDRGSALSMSAFDVAGEVVQRGIKGFIYGERGVWRPGDTIHLGFMLGDREGTLPAGHPVTLELYNPLGQLYTTVTQTTGEMGLYTFEAATEPDAPTGAWNAKVNVGGVSFTKRLRVETVKPNRLKIELDVPEKPIVAGQTVAVPLHAEWLQGATARGLAYDIEGKFTAVTTRFDSWPGYTFDNPARVFEQESLRIAEGNLDAEGNAEVKLRLSEGVHGPGMMRLDMVTRVFEESGDFSIDGSTAMYSPYTAYTGIRSPQTGREQLNTGTSYIYDLAAVDSGGKPQSGAGLEVEIYKVEWYWWWSSSADALANYVSNSYNRPVKTMTLTTKQDGSASFNLSFGNSEWGTYFIQVTNSRSGHTAGVMTYFDWPDNQGRREMEGADAATRLTITTDKEIYRPGEKMTVVFPSSEGARAIVSVENGSKIVSIDEYECTGEETSVQLEATVAMMPNAYVNVTLLQPHGATANDLPIRLYGVVGVEVTSPDSRLAPVMVMKDELRPEEQYEISVSEAGGRPMAYTIAVVDEGLLDLTDFKTPDPWSAFNAREALGVSTWDMYGYVMGAYGGRIEQIFSIGGGDEAESVSQGKTNRFAPVVEFHGPFRLGAGATARHTFTMPNYNGRVRAMVVAGDGKAYGHTEKSVMVRKPVMLLGTLPRVIGVGEEMVVPATVFATEKGVGDVVVTIECSGNMSVSGASTSTLHFTETGDKMTMFRIAVGDRPGTGTVKITASGKGETSVYETDIEIRSVRRAQVKAIPVTLEPGASWRGTVEMPGADGTNSLSLEMSSVQPVNLSSRLDYLLGYPHGCVEQITSKAFPQLYLPQFASLTPGQEQVAREAVETVIRRLRSYQTADGAFAYWPGGSDVNGWAAVYAAHFLCEAESKGWLVPAATKRDAIRYLGRTAKSWRPSADNYARSEELTQAYRLYVLALSGNPELGAMNRLRGGDNLYLMTDWVLAAAYAKAGRTDVAEELTGRVKDIATTGQYDLTFGSDTRDKALRLITLCLIGDEGQAGVLAGEVSLELGSDGWMSTQTTAFALMAVSEYMKRFPVAGEMYFSYRCGTNSGSERTPNNVWTAQMFSGAGPATDVELINKGKGTIFARLITEGTPNQGEEAAYSNGLALDVQYVYPNGKSVNVAGIAQGETFTATAVIKNPTSKDIDHLALTQIFPAGWEIINTRFMNEGDAGTASTADAAVDPNPDSGAVGVSYQDYRDDRVYSYIDRLPKGRQVKVTITLTAVYPGVFYLPPVYCEAMYDNLTRANTAGRTTEVK